ncbi:MAG: hypothetical protein SNJ57_16070 [Cyanobacteriota bacterium]
MKKVGIIKLWQLVAVTNISRAIDFQRSSKCHEASISTSVYGGFIRGCDRPIAIAPSCVSLVKQFSIKGCILYGTLQIHAVSFRAEHEGIALGVALGGYFPLD